jgi:hypothetical protein
MIRKGEDGWDFPCGDSHSRLDSVHGGPGGCMANGRIYFNNDNSGTIYHVTEEEVETLLKKLHKQIELVNLFITNAELRGSNLK